MATHRSSSTSPAPIVFIVPGVAQAPAAQRGGVSAATQAADPDAARVKASVRVGVARGDGGTQRLIAMPGEDVVRLRLEGGPELLLHPQTARELLSGPPEAQTQRRRGSAAAPASNEVLVAPELGWDLPDAAGVTRGGPGLLQRVKLAVIEILVGKAKDAAVEFAVDKIIEFIDGKVTPGVYALPAQGALGRLNADDAQPLQKIPAAADGKPLLVLIHGTFVETSSTFGKLWAQHADEVKALFAAYGAVYALDHHTLGANPFANALPLAAALPDGARLHLLTHSRGGLVAEALARLAASAAPSADELAFFADDAQAQQDLLALHKLLHDKHITVERVVRVACPARGTLLASGRLDVYLSVLSWLLRQAGVPVLPELVQFLDAVAQQRTNPNELPGLAAMVPDSAFVRWLHSTPEPIDGELLVVAGDLKADSIAGFFKTLMADAFYWTDNDIVVHTSSMYGGAPRKAGAGFVLERSGNATHFAYFSNGPTVRAVVDALTLAMAPQFRPIGPLSWSGQSSDGLRGAATVATRGGAAVPLPASQRPAVLVLPGILGSNLAVDGKRIWLGPRVLGGLKKLDYAADGVTPDGPIALIYNDLMAFLQRSHDVVPFAFDWRVPIEQEAERLAAEVQAQLDARTQSGQPVRLLVHSMGGLVARTMQIVKPEVWNRMMAHDGARVLMLGTPNGGSWAPMQVLSGDDSFGNTLVALGAPFSDRAARQMMAQFPGFIGLQAHLTDADLKLDRHETWAELARNDLAQARQQSWWHRVWYSGDGPDTTPAVYEWGVPEQAVLDQARGLRIKLDAQREQALPAFAHKLLLVVGKDEFTPDGYEVSAEQGFQYRNAVNGGDGRVPLLSARLPGVKTWSVDETHGNLPRLKSAHAAYEELLMNGSTDSLASLAEGAGSRGAAAGADAPPRFVLARPARAQRVPLPAGGADDLLGAPAWTSAAAGGSHARALPPLRVRVVNGNLSYIDVPLVLGHYVALALTGTERVVDTQIGGTMSAALALQTGHYPEAPGTHQVFLNLLRDTNKPEQRAKPGAAIVVGLGQEGRLDERQLAATVRQGVLGWLQRVHEQQRREEAALEPVRIAATLIGSGGIGISAGLSARAIVRGVQEANNRVADAHWPAVAELSLIELYLDRATEAWRELHAQAAIDAGSDDAFMLEPLIGTGPGAKRRPLDGSYRGADYDFVRITGQGKGRIEFALDTRRARSEVREHSTQTALVQELVRNAAHSNAGDARLGRTLFHLLVPAALEPYFAGRSRLLLDMSDSVAAIPWELLDMRPDARRQQQQEPWALRCGLLRKLQTHTPPEAGRRDSIADDAVLVIGDPLVTRPGYAALPAARAEAQAVAEALGAKLAPGNVDAVLQAQALAITGALYERDWRIVHVAGHGEWRNGKGGVVLSGPSIFLGPTEIRAMRAVPELVFVNCCHLADTSNDPAAKAAMEAFRPGEFAAGVAVELIKLGVRCVIAAGWAVGDDAAQVFATRFYEQLLEGAPFGDAVLQARRATYEYEQAHGGGNTWAAYQCYGEPAWRFTRGVGQAPGASDVLEEQYAGIASAPALALALESLAIDARWTPGATERVLRHAGWLEGRFEVQMGPIGAVAEAFGLVYGECGRFEKAVEWYRSAFAAKDGTASLKCVERLGNTLTRLAYEQARAARGNTAKAQFEAAEAKAQEALKLLDANAAARDTDEALNLVGSARKRLVMILQLQGDSRRADVEAQLQELRKAYDAALKRAEQTNGDTFYPDQNLLAVMVRSALGTGNADPALNQRIDEVRARLTKALQAKPQDEWVRVGVIELELHEALGKADDNAIGGVLKRFVQLQVSVPGRLVWASVADQLEFLFGALPKPQGQVAVLLAQIRSFAA